MKFIMAVALTVTGIMWAAGDRMLDVPSFAPSLSVPNTSQSAIDDTFPLPAKVHCGGYDYRIIYKLQTGLDGQFSTENRALYLRPGMPHQREQETLYHELSHCAVEDSKRVMQLQNPDGSYQGKYTIDQFIEAVSPDMLRTLRENPKVVEYLLERRVELKDITE